MPIARKTWLLFSFLAILSAVLWFAYSYPKHSFIDLSIDRNKALSIATAFLSREQHVDLKDYHHATIFTSSSGADQYLQKSLGFEKELQFLREHQFELFQWSVRFFRENEKEGYYVGVSASTGEITSFHHSIKETAARPTISQEEAKERVEAFLRKHYRFDPDQYILHSDLSKKFENRTNYSFSWEKKGVFIPWSEKEGTGGARLLTGATIAGDDILSFTKLGFDIPDEYRRYMAKKMDVGRNLAILFRYVFFALLTASIFYVVVRRNDLVTHSTKKFAINLTAVLFVFYLLAHVNAFESILYGYPTSSSLMSYFWQYITGNLLDTFIVTIGILMPCLAGESLRYESFPEKKEASFLHYLLSTFFSQRVSKLIFLGYLTALIMLGIQTVAFEIGERYMGVWVEHSWMAQLSASYFPLLAAFTLGISASFSEEIAFRVFSISLGKKFLKNTFAAVFLASIIWGYGHSTYPVFPMWFRGIEVTCLGLFLSYVYLNYGIIPVLTAHFLFDVFWATSAYLFGRSIPENFFSSITVLALPLIFGVIAYLKNGSQVESVMRWKLNRHQRHNLNILIFYLKHHEENFRDKNKDQLVKEISVHGWDIAVVEAAVAEVFGET